MGNTGGKLKKLRKSLRRLSLSRSKDNLNRNNSTRRSVSLMNLSVLRKNIFQKNKSKSTVVVSDSYDELPMKIEKDLHVITKSSSTSSIQKLPQEDLLDSQSNKGLEHGEKKESDSRKSVDYSIGIEDTKSSEKTNSRILDNETIPKRHSLVFLSSQYSEITKEKFELNETKPETDVISPEQDCSEVLELKKIDETLNDLEQQIEVMSHSNLLLHLPTFKDKIHFLWIKSYDIKDSNEEVYPKKIDTIEYTKKVLQKLYSKAFRQHDYYAREKM